MEHQPRRRRGRSIWHAYTVLAVQACTVVLLLLLVNVIAGILLRIRDERALHRLPPEFRRLESRSGSAWLSTLYPGWSEGDVLQLRNEWAQVRFDYEPFTQFKVHPMRNVHMNVSEHGFRSNGEAAPWPPELTAFNVFVFGGSTTFGVMLPDAQTIPAALEGYLRSSACGSMARVYNFARPGFISTQERALFEQLLLAGAVPHIAVFVEGLNDSLWQGSDPQYTQRLTDLVDRINSEKSVSRLYRQAHDVVASLPMTQLAQLAMTRLWPAERIGEPVAARSNPRDQLERWLANKRIRDAVADEFGVKALTVLQPVPTYHYDLNHHAFGDDLALWSSPGSALEQSKDFYAAMDARRDAPDAQKMVLWLGDMQLAKRENLYVDSLHYTAAFSKEIAGAIFEELQRLGWLSCARPAAG